MKVDIYCQALRFLHVFFNVHHILAFVNLACSPILSILVLWVQQCQNGCHCIQLDQKATKLHSHLVMLPLAVMHHPSAGTKAQ